MILDIIGIYRARHNPPKRMELIAKFAADRTVEQAGVPVLIIQVLLILIAVLMLALFVGLALLAHNTSYWLMILALFPAGILFVATKVWRALDYGMSLLEAGYSKASQKGVEAYRKRRKSSATVETTPEEAPESETQPGKTGES